MYFTLILALVTSAFANPSVLIAPSRCRGTACVSTSTAPSRVRPTSTPSSVSLPAATRPSRPKPTLTPTTAPIWHAAAIVAEHNQIRTENNVIANVLWDVYNNQASLAQSVADLCDPDAPHGKSTGFNLAVNALVSAPLEIY